jgi:hypothetical protein
LGFPLRWSAGLFAGGFGPQGGLPLAEANGTRVPAEAGNPKGRAICGVSPVHRALGGAAGFSRWDQVRRAATA